MSTDADPAVETAAEPRRLRTAFFGVRKADVIEELGRAEADQLILLRELSAARLEIERLMAEDHEHDGQAAEVRSELVRARQTLEKERQALNEERRLIIEAARQHAEEINRRAERRLSEEGWELHRARVERQKFLESFRTLLTQHLAAIDGLGADAKALDSDRKIPTEAVVEVAERSSVPPGFVAPPSHGE